MTIGKVSVLGAVFLWSAITAMGTAPLVSNDRLMSFEESEPSADVSAVNSTISTSDRHYKDGERSLQWDFNPGGVLKINRDLRFEPKDPTGVDTYLSGFVVWVYSPAAAADSLTFRFMKDESECTSFSMGLDFTGWRAAWVCYERDMKGIPQEGMNGINIIAPNREGTLFIDHLLTAAKMDSRYQTADIQVPFVNAATRSHWLQLYNHSRRTSDMPLEAYVTDREKADISTIESRFKEMIYRPSQLSDKRMEGIRRDFGFYNIKRDDDGNITGCPLFFERHGECYERIIDGYVKPIFSRAHMELKEYFNLMNRVAIAYNDATDKDRKDELASIFLDMYDHVTDQGVAYGSCMGNFTHYGYSFRGYYTAYYLMKELLEATGRLDFASKGMLWYAMTGEVYIPPTAWGMDIDTFNTMTTGRIASILMMPDTPEKVRYLKSFSRWLDNGCRPADGLSGCFKPDGAIFHHCNNYPAYAIGGLDGATKMIYLLSSTRFAVSELAHSTVKNGLLAMRFYCNKVEFPISMSGRHPDGKGRLVPVQYAYMALAGTPDGKQDIDKEMGDAFLRLVSVSNGGSEEGDPEYIPTVAGDVTSVMIERLSKGGCRPEVAPGGNMNLGYGCVNVHRRDNWGAVIRGHSRYLWAAEHYRGENLYGRYLAHGSLQLLTVAGADKDVSLNSSGWVENGFDWGRIPGTTARHLPLELLKANVLNVDTYSGYEEMLFSDETFAGGVTLEGKNGAWGMKLHEHDKYDGALRARKSYHMVDGRIVCLGSDIQNDESEYPTETTIFQTALTDDSAHDYWVAPLAGKDWVMDHLGTGYFVPSCEGKSMPLPVVELGRKSISNEGKPTEGDWVNMTINHGAAPKGDSYHYAIYPQSTKEAMEKISREPGYKVLKQDHDAHVVRDDAQGITSYVLFETVSSLPSGGVVAGTDTPCLVMVRELDKKNCVVAVANPDLALYTGEADEIYDDNGRRVERSIYSRPWKDSRCLDVPVTVTLRGSWKLPESDSYDIISRDRHRTVVRFNCREGKTIEASCRK